MIHFEEILEKVEAYNPSSDQDLLRRAYVFSAREHQGQVRRSGEPYLVHPLNVASILADLKADDVSIVVGPPPRRPRGHPDDQGVDRASSSATRSPSSSTA